MPLPTQRTTSTNMNISSTSNTTLASTCSSFDNSQTVKVIKILVLCLIVLSGVVGNSLVLGIFYKCRRMRSTTNRLIFNMAVGDLARSIFYLPIYLASTIANSVKWLVGGDFGLVFCKLLPFIGEVTVAVSIQTLVLIAFDRFYAIIFPLRQGLMTHKVCRFAIALTWIIPIGLFSPIFYTAKLDEYGYCIMDWGPYFDNYITQKNYYISLFVLLYALPLLLISIMYLAIFLELSKKTAHESVISLDVKRRKENKRILQMLVSIVALFAFTWAPLHVYAFLRYFPDNMDMNKYFCQMHTLRIVTVFTMSFGCAFNPFLYFIFLEKYRRNIKVVLLHFVNVMTSKITSCLAFVKRHKKESVLNTCDVQETSL